MCLFEFLGVDFKNMPPCHKVLLNKIKRTDYLASVAKGAMDRFFDQPDEGWVINDGEMELIYFSGNPFPEDLTKVPLDQENDSEDDEPANPTFSDEENSDSEISLDESDEEWNPKK